MAMKKSVSILIPPSMAIIPALLALALPFIAGAQTKTAPQQPAAQPQTQTAPPPPAQTQPPAQTPAPAAKVYMSQAYVDTMILRAIIILNEASAASYSAGGDRQSHAVTRSRAILGELRAKAKGDPNERYALTRISEVEMQLYLEEEEMRKIAEDKRILTSNQLVIQYNGEVGKMRPDFATLRALFRRMAEVDQRQANNMADNYNKRYRQISREAMYSLEKSLTANDFDLAKRELEYCEKNKIYLMIDSRQLERQRERLNKIQGAHTDWPRVVAQLGEGEKAYNEFRLSESRMSLTMASNRINDIRGHIPAKEADAISAKSERLIRALDAREDSLVRLALGVLDKQGPDAAIEYLEDVLQRRMNLSPERAAIVDQAIMKMRPEREITLKSSVKMVEISHDDESHAGASNEIALMRDRARYKAQERADSIKAVRDKAANITINIYTLLENKRPKDAVRLFTREKAFLSSTIDKDAFETLELSVTQGSKAAGNTAELDKNKRKAQDYTARIYALIEKNEIKEAYQRFQKHKKPLSKYLDKDTFHMLELTVTQSYNSMSAKKAKR